MKIKITIIAVMLFFVATISYSAQSLFFDQISTQFVKQGEQIVIPLSVRSLNNNAKVQITQISGLPGAEVRANTDPYTLGPIQAIDLYWTPQTTGVYTCKITATDKSSGTYTTAAFKVIVETMNYNVSPIFSPLGAKKIATNTVLTLPVSASRMAMSGSAALTIKASGLPGGVTLDKLVSSKTNASATVIWQPPLNATGTFVLNLEVSDQYGAYTNVQVPVIVTTGSNVGPVFDQLSTQFMRVGQQYIMPISVKSLNNNAQIQITQISGLPGAEVRANTDPYTLGPIQAIDLYWTPQTAGKYTCLITAIDKLSGTYTTAAFQVIVDTMNYDYNVSPIFSPLGAKKIAANTVLTLPVSASRVDMPGSAVLTIKASGLPGGVTLDKLVSSKTNASATVIWQPPLNATGTFVLNLEVSDQYGVYTNVQVPIIVQ